jgi:peroxiredoxin
VTEKDLMENAPLLLSLYRGWWCPSSEMQLNEIMEQYANLTDQGIKIYAASVDGPEESAALQEHVGDRITILCNLSPGVLDSIGVHDNRGVPWIEQLTSDKSRQSIAMPTALLVNREGRVTFISRSKRVDDRPRIEDILADLS